MDRVPASGLVGMVALREAAATELGQVVDLVSAAVRAVRRNDPSTMDSYASVDSVFPDRVVVVAGGRYYSYPYTIGDDNKVAVGSPTQVNIDYVPAGARVAEAAAGSSGVFIEAIAAADASAPPRYLVRVIRAGTSLNGVEYPAAVLREAVPLFNGVRVFAKNDNAHVKGDPNAKDFRNLVGKLSEPRFVEANGGEIQAVLDVLESSDVAARLREAVTRDMTDLFGLSIDAAGTQKRRGKLREAVALKRVDSVDLIMDPGAGGQIIRFTESVHQENDMLREQMLQQIRQRNAQRADSLSNATDEEVLTAYREAVATEQRREENGQGDGATAPLTAADVDARVQAQVRLVEARANARVSIAGSRLPSALQERLVARFAEAASFTDADVTAAIEGERTLLGRLVEGAQVRGLGDVRIDAGEDRADKVQSMLNDFFDGTKRAHSFREAYIDITGDRGVSGQLANCDERRLREAVGEQNFREAVSSTTFANVLGDSITRAMIREYGALEAYSPEDWKFLCDVVPVNDFRTQHRTRIGGYGNLPAVAENGSYNALTSPSDEEATYKISKRGGTETISLESIANDDVGLLRRIPKSLATAAGRTLYEFVFDFLRNNAVVYDSVALAHATHGNLGTAALDAGSFAAARLAIKAQAEKDSNKKLGLTLRHLIVPAALEETVYNLFVRGTNLDETFVQSRKPKAHVIDYWTDVNDWWACADNAQVPLIELGFYGGQENPELFVQDLPTQGSLFTNDQIKYKIRHIYSGAVRDYRGFYGAIVA